MFSKALFFYFAGTSDAAESGNGKCTRDFIIIPNTDKKVDRFCGNALEAVTSEFQVRWRVISEL